MTEIAAKRTRGRPKGVKNKTDPGLYYDMRKRRLFAKAINRNSVKTVRELRLALENIEDLVAVEIMAIRALLRAAEVGSHESIRMILTTTSKAVTSLEPKLPGTADSEKENLPDPSEFNPSEHVVETAHAEEPLHV